MQNSPQTNPSGITMGSRVAALVISIAGLAALGGGYVVYQNSLVPKSYVTTQGVITHNAPGLDNRTYDIGIKFTANDGKDYKFTTSVASESAQHSAQYFIGNNTIKVAYDPQNPGHKPKNATDKTTPAYAFLIMGIGSLFTLIGLISTIQQLIFRKR
jgi:hypothetical protein